MSGSQGSFSGAIPGLSLVGWALIIGGALVKGFNVTSIGHGATGQWQLNLTNNIASNNVVMDARINNNAASGGPLSVCNVSCAGLNTVSFRTEDNAVVLRDPFAMWVGVYL